MTKKTINRTLQLVYEKLYKAFGSQNWWPGETPFEIMMGAILTQNAAWTNAEKAIKNLKHGNVLSIQKLSSMKKEKLSRLIRPSGFYNVKAKRLKNFLYYLSSSYSNNIKKMKKKDLKVLREELLRVDGIGKETADSILLYALEKPVFVIDAYTKRILVRHGIVGDDVGYDQMQRLFMDSLPHKRKLFNEYHALIVETGKNFCKATKPLCRRCPLKGI